MTPSHSAEVRIVNRLGMHARPAALFVRASARYRSEIYVSRDGVEIHGTSIMGVMMLAAEHGSTIVIRAAGEDSEDALAALRSLVANGFGEE